MKTLFLSISGATGKEYDEKISAAARIIRNGGLAAVPTETVYGLAANALDENAVRRIFEVKGRPQDNPLIVHVAFPEDIEKYTSSVPPLAEKAIKAFMPGPFTAILPKSPVLPDVTTAGLSSVAVRCPIHPIMHDIIAEAGVPIAAPSANLSGKPSPTLFSHCVDDLDGKVEAIADGGACSVGVESTVVSFLGEKAVICRPGAVTREMLEAVLGCENVGDASEEKTDRPLSPGMKYRHYSPSVPVCVVTGKQAEDYISMRCRYEKGLAVMGYDGTENRYDGAHFFSFGKRDDAASQAARLFAALREADTISQSLSLVLSVAPPCGGEGAAVLNRLNRAAAQNILRLPDKTPPVIGVTGKSGSGKSAVADAAAGLTGFCHINCDLVANSVIWGFAPLTERIKKEFSVDNRKELSKKVFSDAAALERLNFLVLPVIVTEIDKIIAEETAKGAVGFFVDGATLIESGFAARCDGLAAVTASDGAAFSRIAARDSIDTAAAKKRLDAQKPRAFYESSCDIIIDNGGAVSDAARILSVWAKSI